MLSRFNRYPYGFRAMVLSFLVFALSDCATSPTGRSQLSLVSDSQMNDLGEKSFAEMKKKMKINGDPATNRYVKCVANAVLRVVPTEIKNWEIVVFEEPSANAFALPGGKIGVHTGILKVATTADQLAAVLGHEVAHVTARHGAERVSQSLVTEQAMAVASVVLDPRKPQSQYLLAAVGLGAQFGILLPYGRKQESEADEIGLLYLAEAGFNPQGAVTLWQNMQNQSQGEPPQFLSTHPSSSSRIQNLSDKQPQARELWNQARGKGFNPNCPR